MRPLRHLDRQQRLQPLEAALKVFLSAPTMHRQRPVLWTAKTALAQLAAAVPLQCGVRSLRDSTEQCTRTTRAPPCIPIASYETSIRCFMHHQRLLFLPVGTVIASSSVYSENTRLLHEHRQIARLTFRQSAVLLKNFNEVLRDLMAVILKRCAACC